MTFLAHRAAAAGFAGALALAWSGAAWAQEVPTTAEPSAIEKSMEESTAPKATFEPVVPPLEQQQTAPEEAKKIRFNLSGVMVMGATVYPESAFTPFYDRLLGKEVSLADIYDVAAAITAKYGNDGYILSQAIVPPQTIQGGIVRLQVVEGFINRVVIEGEIEGRQALLEAYAEKITRSRPLRAKDLERYLLLTDDLPGVDARGVLRPSPDQPGASDLTVVIDHKDFDHVVAFDNRGTRFVGPFQASYTLRANSVFGLYEQTRLRYTTATQADELQFFEGVHEEQIGSEGTKVFLSGQLVRSEPGFTLEDLGSESASETVILMVTHPFIRSRSQNLTARASFTYNNAESDLLGLEVFDDQIRTFRAGVTYDTIDPLLGINLFDFEVSQGVDILGASEEGSPNLSRANGRTQFTKFTADYERLQRLVPRLNLLLAVSGQYSGSQLLSAEEFGVGGGDFGRAYDGSEITGDHGIAAKAELQYTIPYGRRFLDGVQVYGYYDAGATWRIDPGDNSGTQRESLAALGGGLRINVNDYVSGFVEVGLPLTRPVGSEGPGKGNDPRVFFSVTARF